MIRKILITGANGMLGRDLTPVFESRYELFATDKEEMDIRDFKSVDNTVSEFEPDLLLHLGAMTHVDNCEKFPDQAYLTNTVGTKNIALICRKLDIELVYLSTHMVFDGTKNLPYNEFDKPNPINVYGNSKYQGEQIIRNLVPRHYIARSGWLFGGGEQDKKFVAKIIELMQKNTELPAVNDKFGSPTYTVDLAKMLVNLIESGLSGTYHVINAGGPVSRYQLAEKIREYSKQESCTLNAVPSSHFPLPAPRPSMEAGDNLHFRLSKLPEPRHWTEALREYIDLRLSKKQ